MPVANDARVTKRTIRIFGFASFLNDLGGDLVFSIWPLFLTEVLGANKAAIGLIDGLGDSIVSISQAVSGYLSDKLRRRKVFVWMGYFFGSIAKIGYSVVPAWQFVLPLRMLDRSGKMRGAPRDAIVSDLSVRENRGDHFGFIRMMDNMGAVIGILLAALLLGRLGYRTMFALAAVPSLAAAILVVIGIREPKDGTTQVFKGLRLAHFDGNLQLLLLTSALFSLGSFSYSFLLLFATAHGFASTAVPLLYLLFTVVAAAFSLPMGRLSDRIGRKTVLALSFLCWALVPIASIASAHPLAILGIFFLYGLHKAALEPAQKAFIAELAPAGYTASTLGTFQMVIGLMALPSSLLAGMLWDRFGAGAPMAISLGLTVIAGALLMFVREK